MLRHLPVKKIVSTHIGLQQKMQLFFETIAYGWRGKSSVFFD
jgi:hypothetical protein